MCKGDINLEIKKPKYTQDFFDGIIHGDNVEHYQKKFGARFEPSKALKAMEAGQSSFYA